MINEKPDGYGKYIFEDGICVKGRFKHGLINGIGILFDKNGKIDIRVIGLIINLMDLE